MQTRVRRFWKWFLPLVALHALFPALIPVVLHDTDAGLRWIFNDPAAGIYSVLVLPASMALLASLIRVNALRAVTIPPRIAPALTAVLFLLAAWAVIEQGRTIPSVPPHMWHDSTGALEKENEIRTELDRSITLMAESGFSAEARKTYQASRTIHVSDYAPFAFTAEHFIAQSSALNLFGLGLSIIGAAFVVGLVTYVVIRFWFTSVPVEDWELQGITLVLFLQTIWFPVRIYANWYRDFYATVAPKPDIPLLLAVLWLVAVLILKSSNRASPMSLALSVVPSLPGFSIFIPSSFMEQVFLKIMTFDPVTHLIIGVIVAGLVLVLVLAFLSHMGPREHDPLHYR